MLTWISDTLPHLHSFSLYTRSIQVCLIPFPLSQTPMLSQNHWLTFAFVTLFKIVSKYTKHSKLNFVRLLLLPMTIQDFRTGQCPTLHFRPDAHSSECQTWELSFDLQGILQALSTKRYVKKTSHLMHSNKYLDSQDDVKSKRHIF